MPLWHTSSHSMEVFAYLLESGTKEPFDLGMLTVLNTDMLSASQPGHHQAVE